MDLEQLQRLVTHRAVQSLLIAVLGWALGWIVDRFGTRIAMRMAEKTSTDWDDEVVLACRRPVRQSVFIAALWIAVDLLDPPGTIERISWGILCTWAILLWTGAGFKLTAATLSWVSSRRNRFPSVNDRTLPVFEMVADAVMVASAGYFIFLAWNLDVTGWLASAGIIGVAVGFGAKDTIANLFAGVSILADAPYKLGDFLLLDTGERGRVTDIGLRSTRMLTADEFEIIIPNAQMASARIINESGGPRECERVSIAVGVAYGSDVDRVREVLLDVASGVSGVLTDDARRAPSVQFVEMGESALAFQLHCFIARPEDRIRTLDQLNTHVYKRLQAEGIEIPFPKRDLYIRRED